MNIIPLKLESILTNISAISKALKGTAMLSQVIMVFYRILAISLILTPIVLNIMNKGDIVYSLLYLPLLTLMLTIFFIFIDQKLERCLLSINKKYKRLSINPRLAIKRERLKVDEGVIYYCKYKI